MLETPEELAELQAVLDRSFERRGRYAAAIVTPERRLTAAQTVTYLQNAKPVVLATVSARNEPVGAPLDGWFLHGRFVVSTGGESVRARHLKRRPQVSVCHVNGDDCAFWVHGTAERVPLENEWAADFRRLAMAAYGSDPFSWDDDLAVFVIHPRVMFSYASEPGKYPPFEGD